MTPDIGGQRVIGLRATIRRDALRQLDHHAAKPLTFKRLGKLALTPEFRLVLSYRLYSWLHGHGVVWLSYILYTRARSRTGCDLAPEARIGPGLRIGHRSDVVIGGQAVLGVDVYVFNGVTIGKRWPTTDGAMATVGDRVLLGSGAKILGGVTIGADAIVGANSVVLHDVPAGATVAGSPARAVNPSKSNRATPLIPSAEPGQ